MFTQWVVKGQWLHKHNNEVLESNYRRGARCTLSFNNRHVKAHISKRESLCSCLQTAFVMMLHGLLA